MGGQQVLKFNSFGLKVTHLLIHYPAIEGNKHMPISDLNINFIPELIIGSPGRINIIGEHTDYNMGYVLPTAIDKKIIFKLRKNQSANLCRITSEGYDGQLTADLVNITKSPVEWENYILGVLHQILQRSDNLKGFDCSIESYLPIGSGISSSAALECGLAYGLNELFDLGLTKKEIVILCRDAEHSFVGTQCGIMDQFASVMSKEGHVILLDCESFEYQYIPLTIEPYKLVLLNTNVSHSLASGEYNRRRAECEQGLAVLQKSYPGISSLRQVTKSMLENCIKQLNPVVYNRCFYVVEENSRVLKAVELLKQNNLKELGQLLYKTHKGLSELYEVSCPELDFLVDYSKKSSAVLGARMMGGGFGGCTINIIHKDAINAFVKEATGAYKKEFNNQLTTFEALPGKGTSIIS